MIFALSGEGPTDLGGVSPDGQFIPGPMFAIIDVIFEKYANYSPHQDTVFYYREKDLSNRARNTGRISLPGHNQHKRFYTQNATMLAELSKELAERENCDVIAVFFRDTDPTQNDKSGSRTDKVQSIKNGFKASDFSTGIAMMPSPISEAWLVCGVKNKHQNCATLETLGKGKHDMKKILAECLEYSLDRQQLYELIKPLDGQAALVDPFSIDMPSFNEFRKDLEKVLASIFGPIS